MLKIAELLVKNGALVDIKNDKSFIAAPLSIASCRGHLEIAKLLLQNGADIECRGYNIKESSLYQAAKYGHFEMAQLLLDRNASLTFKDKDGLTPHEIAKQNKHKKISRLLYEKMIESMESIKKECAVCFGPRNGTVTFLPCGHAKTCETCCKKIVAKSESCPICRKKVDQYQRIFD